jgi:hypothetical protein
MRVAKASASGFPPKVSRALSATLVYSAPPFTDRNTPSCWTSGLSPAPTLTFQWTITPGVSLTSGE